MSDGKQILVVYYSLTGNTARLARDLAVQLGADIESIRDRGHGVGFWGALKAGLDAMREVPAQIEPPQRDPSSYALTLIGTPVWGWKMTPAVRAYLQASAGRLREVGFFITSGNTPVAKLLPSLEGAAKRPSIAAAGFNAHELAHTDLYEKKLADLVAAIRAPRAQARSAA